MNPGPEAPQQDPAAAPVETDAAAASERPRGGPSWLLLGGVALLVMLLVRGFLVQSFYVPSGSMEPTIEPGDRILVNKLADGDAVRRGDVVVFDGTTTLRRGRPHPAPGRRRDRQGRWAARRRWSASTSASRTSSSGSSGCRATTWSAATAGSLTVNGKAIDEPYVMPGDEPSELEFDVTVPAGRLWVMGDHRSDSADSRSHLGDPGGGTVRLSDVIGRASATYWPLSRLGGFERPDALADLPRVGEP